MADEELGAVPWHEDAGSDGQSQAAELGPAEDVLQRQTGDALLHHGVERVGRAGFGHEQPCFVLGEHAPGGAQPGHDVRPFGR